MEFVLLNSGEVLKVAEGGASHVVLEAGGEGHGFGDHSAFLSSGSVA